MRMKIPLKRKAILWAATIPLIVIGLIVAARCSKTQTAQPGPPEVMVVQVEQKDVPIYSEWIGTLEGMVNAEIKAQVTGYLVKQDYSEGTLVKKGQVLFEIDARPLQARPQFLLIMISQNTVNLSTCSTVLRHWYDGDGLGLGLGPGDPSGDGLGDAFGDGAGVGIGLGDGDNVGKGDGLGEGLREGDGAGVPCGVALA